MLPCAIRRRSASGVMSTSSTCSAARTTSSGTVSRCGTPVICLDHVVERLQVLDVDGGQHGDAGVEQLLDVLPALGVAAAGHVGVRQLVDERDLRAGGRARASTSISVNVGAAVGASVWRGTHLQAARAWRRSCGRPWVSTKPTTTSVPRSRAAVRLLEHRVGLADAGGGAEVDPQLSACHRPEPPRRRRAGLLGRSAAARVLPVEGEVELEHVDRRLADEAEGPAGGVLLDQLLRPGVRSTPRALATRGACSSA